MTRAIALILTVMTGFSGLVYEIAWQKYLATLLGSHSEATAAVLAIFLGGLSVGYWLFGVVTRRVVENAARAGTPPRLLLVYGGLEFSIGVYVIAFPWLFKVVQALSFAIPHGSGGFGFAIDVALTVLLIGPASVMMGGTIPILTQALSRSLDDATRFHAFIYAFNTAGAFAGAIAAGFYLIPVLGLKNLMLAMGTINLFAGAVFILIGFRGQHVYATPKDEPTAEAVTPDHFITYGTIALLTGFAMMVIQTAIIRVGGVSFGSSQFTFSMVVAVFVLCIALGSFGVSALTQIPRGLVVGNQWLIGLILWVLYTQVDKAPYAIQTLRTLIRSSDAAFGLYHAVGFAFVLVAIGLPVFLSGAALPLLFHHMRREVDHLGDLAGNLYSWNTVGSLLGALLGGYVLLFWLDLHQIFRLAIAALIAAASLLTIRVYGWHRVTGATVTAVMFVALYLMPAWDPRLMYAGLFRMRDPLPGQYDGLATFVQRNSNVFDAPFLFQTDDPIASITVRPYLVPGGGTTFTIATNGKSDGNSHRDYPTMGLLASLPALLADPAERAFVIGWGTGITVGELASLDTINEVVVAELSPGVMEAAPIFDPVNLHALDNPKVKVIASDAYRALMRAEGTFDLIVSEPSNPWVTGVEMLFTKEFLEAARSKLSPRGVYCQWMHLYETDQASLELVLRTYSEVFDHLSIWGSVSSDLLILGFNDPGKAQDPYWIEERFNRSDFSASFSRAGVSSITDLFSHELVPMDVIPEIELRGPLHSLYHPRLSHTAGIAFFRGDTAQPPFTGFGKAAKVGAKRSMLRRYRVRTGGRLSDHDRAAAILETCDVFMHRCQTMLAEWMSEAPTSDAFHEIFKVLDQRAKHSQPGQVHGHVANADDMKLMAALFDGASPEYASKSQRSLDEAWRSTELYIDYYHHNAPFDPSALLDVWSTCSEVRITGARCRDRLGLPATGKLPAEQKATVTACRQQREAGPACAAGAAAAKALVTNGTLPPGLGPE